MKKSEVPQDDSFLRDISRELCYAKNENEKYETALSKGWNVKHEALVVAWEDINERLELAREQVMKGRKSPIYYFMEKNLMDVALLSAYTGFWKYTIRRHFKPKVFANLSDKKLAKYALAFDLSVDQLKNFNPAHDHKL